MAKRGRPAFKPTPKLRRTVEEMRACGESENSVARALGIDVDTMRKHFPEELSTGLAKRRREVIELLFKNARKGNVSAQKTLEHMTSVAAAAAEFNGDKPSDSPKPPKLGKKEQAKEAANTAGAGTDWGDDLTTPPTRPN